MDIERASPLYHVTPVEKRVTSDDPQTAHENMQPKAEASSEVKLSDAQAKLMQPSHQDINLQRVEAIKQRINNNALVTKSDEIADALLKTAVETFAVTKSSIWDSTND